MNTPRSPRRLARALTALGVTAALGFGSLIAAPAASADQLIPGNKIGDLVLSPTNGTMADRSWFTNGGSISSTATCPDGTQRSRSRVINVTTGEDALAASSYRSKNNGALTTGWGMDGQPLNLTPTAPLPAGANANVVFSGFSQLFGYVGEFDFVITCDPGAVSGGVGESPYFSIRLVSDGANWTVKAQEPAEKTDTTLELGGTALQNGAVKLTATVKAEGQTATAAQGDVTFNGTGGITGTGTLSNGVAEFTTDVLTAGTEYTFTASFGGDTAYNGSNSNEAKVTTVAAPAEPIDTEITVTIPAGGPGTLSFTGAETATLATATEEATTYDASGALSAVTITDSRETKAAWTVNGKVKPFTSDGLPPIGANVLGWTPKADGTLPAGVEAGAAVAPGTGENDGLAVDRPLAKAAADGYSAEGTVTAKVSADLRFSAPKSGVQAGNYATTLTLTLL
jgi:YD repeat-containing protein